MGIALLTFLLVNCAPPSHTNFRNIAPEFIPYVQLFEHEANRLGRPLKITSLIVEFDDLSWHGATTIGLCHHSGGTYPPRVIIDREFWDSATSVSREILMFHELGHCVLDLDHNDTWMMLDSSVWGPSSVMNSVIIGDYFYVSFREKYLQELFF